MPSDQQLHGLPAYGHPTGITPVHQPGETLSAQPDSQMTVDTVQEGYSRTARPFEDRFENGFRMHSDGTVTLLSSRQLGESVSEHCYAVLQGPPLPGRDH